MMQFLMEPNGKVITLFNTDLKSIMLSTSFPLFIYGEMMPNHAYVGHARLYVSLGTSTIPMYVRYQQDQNATLGTPTSQVLFCFRDEHSRVYPKT
jgi:hypothetical protein